MSRIRLHLLLLLFLLQFVVGLDEILFLCFAGLAAGCLLFACTRLALGF